MTHSAQNEKQKVYNKNKSKNLRLGGDFCFVGVYLNKEIGMKTKMFSLKRSVGVPCVSLTE